MATFKKVTHCLFDLDGLMIDSESLYCQVFTAICQQYGKEYTTELRVKHMGTQDMDTARIFIEELQLPCAVQDFYDEQQRRMNAVLPNAQLMPGVERLVRHLESHGVPIAVATSSTMESFEVKTQRHAALFSLFSHVVAAGTDPEVTRGKPAPDIYLVCSARFSDRPPADKVLVFEDAPVGVAGAVAAGMQVVMVPEAGLPDEKKAQATLVLRTLEDFRPELFGLPPFPGQSSAGCDRHTCTNRAR